MLAVEDMRLLVGHVTALLDDDSMRGSEISDWLSDLDYVLVIIDQAISEGKIGLQDDLTIDDEGPSDLDEVLQRRRFAEDCDWRETDPSKLLAKLIDYWLDQVVARGYGLIHLLIGADDVVGAAESLTRLNQVSYPLE